MIIFVAAIACAAVLWQAHLIGAQADRTLAIPSAPVIHPVPVAPPVAVKPVVKVPVAPPPIKNIPLLPMKTNVNANTNKPPAKVAPVTFPAAVDLPVPFTSQAPYQKWDKIHEETCEEADMFMVDKYFKGEAIAGASEADAALLKIIAWEKINLGHYEDTSAAEIMRTLNEFYGLNNVSLLADPTVADLKGALAQGFLVLLPADGKELLNPNFKNGGPPYHVLLLRGYTADGHWITNDPGTHLGNGFLYPQDNLMTAMHDFIQGDTAHGRKVVIVIKPNK